MSKPLCTSAITCHAFSKDGALCALCPNSNEIYIYETNGADDTAKWVKKWTLEEHSNYVTALDFNAEGVLVSCGQDRNAYVWKRVGNDWRPELCVLRLDRAATDVKWSPTGKKFAVASGMKVVAVCYYEHQNNWWVSKHIKKHRSTVLSVAWCPNDKFVVTGATDNRARIFSAFIKNIDREEDDGFGSLFPSQNQFGELLMEFDQSRAWVNSVAWAPSGLRIAYSTHASQVVFVQLLAQGSHVQVLNHAGLPFLKCEFASDNTLVCVGFDMNPTVFTATGDAAAPKWALAKLLDSNEKKADDAAKGATSAAAAARAMWSNKDAKAIETPANSTLAETVLPTRHQNSIVSLCRFKKPTVFSTAAIDGRVLFWDLAASGVAV